MSWGGEDYGDSCEDCGEFNCEHARTVEQGDGTWLCGLCIDRRAAATWVDGPDSEAARAARGEGAESRMRELVKRAARSAGRGEEGHAPRWSAVGYVFGLGSTSAAALCRELGLDPDEEMGNAYDD